MINVTATMSPTWYNTFEVDEIYIAKGDTTIHMDKEEWKLIQEVLAGKHEKATSGIKEGDYKPHYIAVWSKKEQN